MADLNIKQVYDNNPSTELQDADLLYAGRAPYGLTDDTAILFINLLAQVANSLNVKAGCAAATTGNLNATYNNGASGVGATLTNAGALAAFSTDGAVLAVGRRVLVWKQTNQFENGIYEVVTAGSGAVAWVLRRTTDFNSSSNISINCSTYVTGGTLNTGKNFGLATAAPYTVGVTNLVFAYPTGGVSFTEQSGYIGLSWTDFTTSSAQSSAIMGTFTETTTSATLKINTNNFANNASLVTYTLPSTASVGDIIRVMYKGAGGWKIEQPASVSIQIGNQTTTVGVGGSLQFSDVGDNVTLMCKTANTEWEVISVVGNITVV